MENVSLVIVRVDDLALLLSLAVQWRQNVDISPKKWQSNFISKPVLRVEMVKDGDQADVASDTTFDNSLPFTSGAIDVILWRFECQEVVSFVVHL